MLFLLVVLGTLIEVAREDVRPEGVEVVHIPEVLRVVFSDLVDGVVLGAYYLWMAPYNAFETLHRAAGSPNRRPGRRGPLAPAAVCSRIRALSPLGVGCEKGAPVFPPSPSPFQPFFHFPLPLPLASDMMALIALDP